MTRKVTIKKSRLLKYRIEKFQRRIKGVLKNKAVCTTTSVAGGWAGAVMSWAGAVMSWAGA